MNDEESFNRGTIGLHAAGGDQARCVLIHASPPDQELVEVVLLEPFICLEEGEIIQIPRREFVPE